MGRSTPNHRNGGREVTQPIVGSTQPSPGTTTYGVYLRDLSHARTQSHGIVNYAVGLVNALAGAVGADERLLLLANSEIRDLLPVHPRIDIEAGAQPPRGIRRIVEDQIVSVRAAAACGAAVLHFPKGFLPLVRPSSVPLIATVHDDIPVQYWRGAWGGGRSARTAYFAWNVGHAVRRADGLLTVSNFTRSQLQRRWPRAQAVVTGQGVSLPDVPFVPVDERDPVALHFGSRLPHKRSGEGLRKLLQWLDANQAQGIDAVHVLGALDAQEEAAADSRVRILQGGRSNREVADLLARARILLFPSAYEGFGLPPLEAAVLGTPAVYARIPAVEEVIGQGAAGGYDPDVPATFEVAMRAALDLDDAALQQRGRALRERHDWDRVAATTLAMYRRLARPATAA